MFVFISKCEVGLIYLVFIQVYRRGRGVISYLLFGRFILEVGVLDVIGFDGLVFFILGVQVLYSFGDGQFIVFDVFIVDFAGSG